MAIHGKTRDKVTDALRNREPFRNSTGSFQGIEGAKDIGRLAGDDLETFLDDDVTYTVYSYSTPIAWVTRSGLVRIPATKYSRTTSQHQSVVRICLT